MNLSLQNICSISTSVNSSINAKIWQIISMLPYSYVFLALLIIIIWFVFELVTRNGNFHYNSANGFSPLFNSFVGSGLYAFYYGLVMMLPEQLFGGIAYCFTLPFITHVIIFGAVKFTLKYINLWKY